MSFQDLERGRAVASQGALIHNEEGVYRAVVAAVFKINTAVASYKRLVNTLGTPKDTLDLRPKLRTTRLQIRQLVRETSAQLDHIRETDKYFIKIDARKKVADAKLAKDYEAVLKEFEKVQLLAAEKEMDFPRPMIPDTIVQPPSGSAAKLEEMSSSNPKQQASLLAESNRHAILHLEDEITYNEALIAEREQDMIEIQQQIGEVNEIFQDLALLVREQGAFIDDISSNVEGSHATTAEATSQLAKASNIQRSISTMTCLMLVALGIILLLVVVVIVAE